MSSREYNNATIKARRISPREAIRKHCRICNGTENPASCSAKTCPAFSLRRTKAEPGANTGLRTIRAVCLDCAGSPVAVRDCTANTPFGDNPACHLWPYRNGKRQVSEKYREARRAQANEQLRKPGQGSQFTAQDAS